MNTSRTILILAALLAGFASTASGSIRSGVSLDRAAQEAINLTASRPGWEVMVAEGRSMAPHFAAGDILITDSRAFARIRPGMIVVYRDKDGDLVGHSVTAASDKGWMVKGINNHGPDPDIVNASNFIGVLVGILHTNGKRSNSTPALPTVIGKTR